MHTMNFKEVYLWPLRPGHAITAKIHWLLWARNCASLFMGMSLFTCHSEVGRWRRRRALMISIALWGLAGWHRQRAQNCVCWGEGISECLLIVLSFCPFYRWGSEGRYRDVSFGSRTWAAGRLRQDSHPDTESGARPQTYHVVLPSMFMEAPPRDWAPAMSNGCWLSSGCEGVGPGAHFPGQGDKGEVFVGGARYCSEMPGPRLRSWPLVPDHGCVELRISLCPFGTQYLENLFPCSIPVAQNQMLLQLSAKASAKSGLPTYYVCLTLKEMGWAFWSHPVPEVYQARLSEGGCQRHIWSCGE